MKYFELINRVLGDKVYYEMMAESYMHYMDVEGWEFHDRFPGLLGAFVWKDSKRGSKFWKDKFSKVDRALYDSNSSR